MKKLIAITTLSLTLSFGTGSLTYAAKAGLTKTKDGVFYLNEDKSKVKSTWKKISGDWYYFNSDGSIARNTWIGNYYLNADGIMLSNTVNPEGYRLLSDGKWDGLPKRVKAKYLSNLLDLNLMSHSSYTKNLNNRPVYEDDDICCVVSYYGQPVSFNKNQIVDKGSFYEITNVELSTDKQFDSEDIKTGDFNTVSKNTHGKWVRSNSKSEYDSTTYYKGSFYINKDAVVLFRDAAGTTQTSNFESFIKSKNLNSYKFSLLEVDEFGYGVKFRFN